MDVYFGEYYREAHLEPSDELLKKRWKGIEQFSKNLTNSKIADLARLFHGRGPKSPNFQSEFRTPFLKADNAFQMKGNDNELAVLAGATLVHILNGKDKCLGDVGAFAILCPGFQGNAKAPVVPDIQEQARKYLEQRSASLRASEVRDATRIPIPAIDQSLQEISEACNTNTIQNLGAPLPKILKEIGTATEEIIEGVSQIQRNQLLYREESDILWWMQGKHSRDLKVPLDQIDLAAASIVAGKELADITKVLPGPFAARGVLYQILLRKDSDICSQVTLSSAISGSSKEWRQKWAQDSENSEILDLCPILFGVNKSLETDNIKGWYSAFKKVTTLSASMKITPVEIAMETYEESLFLKAFNSNIRGK